MAHLQTNTSELQPTRLLRRLQSAAITAALATMCVAVLGTVVLCGAPEDRDPASMPLRARPVDLNIGDLQHNACIRMLVDEMEQNDYLLNGLTPIADDRAALLRGRQSAFVTTHDHPGTLEWRLQASLHDTFKAHSFVALRTSYEPFSRASAEALQNEWQIRSAVLPREVVTAGRDLLMQATDMYEQDAAACTPASTVLKTNAIVQRGWQEHGENPKSATRRYALTIKRSVPGYVVVLELRDEIALPAKPMGYWVSIDFISIPSPTS